MIILKKLLRKWKIETMECLLWPLDKEIVEWLSQAIKEKQDREKI